MFENRQVAMNLKYKDPDESDKPYHKRSAARMRDPKRINSPTFKKFMLIDTCNEIRSV